MHEASRRALGVILRQIDGFTSRSGVVVLAATNRRADLDPALLSRFSVTVTFGLPDEAERQAIFSEYARQLRPKELRALAAASEGLSGRDIQAVAEGTERMWATRIARGQEVRGEGRRGCWGVDMVGGRR